MHMRNPFNQTSFTSTALYSEHSYTLNRCQVSMDITKQKSRADFTSINSIIYTRTESDLQVWLIFSFLENNADVPKNAQDLEGIAEGRKFYLW